MKNNNNDTTPSIWDFETNHKPSFIHEYLGEPTITKLSRDIYSVSYIADDTYPHVDVDLNIFKSDTEEFEDALCIDSYGENIIDMTLDFEDRLRVVWIDHAVKSTEFISYCEDEFDMETETVEAKAVELAGQVFDDNINSSYFSDMFDFGYEAQQELFETLREEGAIGAKYAVMLEVYQHSGESWSISGHGMGDRWDTTSRAGVFIPNEDQLNFIKKFAANYVLGDVKYNEKEEAWHAYLDEDFGGEDSFHKSYDEAHHWLHEKIDEYRLVADPEKLEDVSYGLACGYAKESLDVYNDIVAGNVYGVCSEIHRIDPSGSTELLRDESTWGYIGDGVYECMEESHYWDLPKGLKKDLEDNSSPSLN